MAAEGSCVKIKLTNGLSPIGVEAVKASYRGMERRYEYLYSDDGHRKGATLT